MKLIVGLGNPGREYEETRHNIGFMVIDELSRKWNIPLNQDKFKGIFGSGMVNGEKVVLLKPLTYMNLSGESIRPLMEYYKIEIEDFMVIYDDLDLIPGKLRLRTKGGAGGHNGIKSTIAHLGTQEFNRIRVGVGRPEGHMNVVDHVLGRFGPEEKQDVLEAVVTSVEACDAWMGQSFLNVMNKFNGK